MGGLLGKGVSGGFLCCRLRTRTESGVGWASETFFWGGEGEKELGLGTWGFSLSSIVRSMCMLTLLTGAWFC